MTSDHEDDKPELLVKLQERKERHKERNRIYRAGVVIVGVLVILLGLVMSGPGVPGPGFLVVLFGLSLIALEFDRAERLLERLIVWADRFGDWVQSRPAWMKATASALGMLALAGFVVAAILWDIPLLPV